MEHLAPECIDARNIGKVRGTEETAAGDHYVAVNIFGDASGTAELKLPMVAGITPSSLRHGRAQPDLGANAILIDDMIEVFLELLARREVALPRIVPLELVLVQEGADVDTRFRIVVEVPGATDVVLPLDDLVIEAESI